MGEKNAFQSVGFCGPLNL